ncbi:hypothetical protein H257_02712 [Aphanomyces astaci]|uniref:IBR domain-containing protein n=1 Tax=Aphanomyces astaci TaxID=112090 RepID=W4H576_APHAT|nr:hypothetical protein H257_02712 [Aphanomyces astaci]ETV86293.1 hypothetical protein H257_02712 [Aphanomyces astaci]|eukprot:XP_009824765.1 hypothetical protein H257_02712 [Aphanomyces astaci]
MVTKVCPSCTAALTNDVLANAVHCDACKTIYCWWCEQVISKESIAQHYNVKGKGCRVVQLPQSPTASTSLKDHHGNSGHPAKSTLVCIWLNHLWRVLLTPVAMLCAFVTAMCRGFTQCPCRRHEPLDDMTKEEPPTAAAPDVVKHYKAEVHPMQSLPQPPPPSHPPTNTHIIHSSAYAMYANL